MAVGKSEDGTRELVASLGDKVKILDTVWDNKLTEGGRVLAEETDKAFQAIAADADWCVYIQGDEVMHEDGYDEVMQAMLKWKDDETVDGLLFKYRHFFGSYNYVGLEASWYRNEIRVIKNNKSIYSFRDAQGFRKGNNKKLQVKSLNAFIHHYGWVQSPYIMKSRIDYKAELYHNGHFDETKVVVPEDYAFTLIHALQKFTLKHPQVMQNRIDKVNWVFDYDESKNKLTLKDHFKNITEKLFGRRFFDYKNYKII